MGRQAVKHVHTDDIKIDQLPDTSADLKNREPEIIQCDPAVIDKDYMAELAFNEERVTIRIEPSSEKNAPTAIFCAVNGKGCEIWDYRRGQWVEKQYIPIGIEVTVKRKYVAVLASAKSTNVTTKHDDIGAEIIQNRETRITSGLCTFSVTEDKSPKGHAWLTALRQRNF
jgi:hypothetical protein